MAIIPARDMADVVPQPPEWLSQRAVERWLTLWPQLDRSRIDPAIHMDIVCIYCEAYADYREACEGLATEAPKVIRDGEGRTSTSPYLKLRNDAIGVLTEVGQTLGLLPEADAPPAFGWNQISAVLLVEQDDGSEDPDDDAEEIQEDAQSQLPQPGTRDRRFDS